MATGLGTRAARFPSRVLDAAFPPSCAGCDVEGEALCPACAEPLDARLRAPPGTPIGLPSAIPRPLLQLEWCAPYSGTVRRALHALKYGGERRLAGPLGAAIARRWAAAGAGGDVLVPVPADARRVAERGYDQAHLIAIAAGGRLGLAVLPLLVRTRATVAQFDLDRAARAGNVRDAFAVAPVGSRSGGLAGGWFVLVDDVVTTGSTLAACARVLYASGALGVSAITVARER